MENKSIQMRITDETSCRITSLRFLLIVFVVCIHANLKVDDALNYYHLDFVQPIWIGWIKDFICGTLGGAAVPLFFLFSAYLQFSKCVFAFFAKIYAERLKSQDFALLASLCASTNSWMFDATTKSLH